MLKGLCPSVYAAVLLAACFVFPAISPAADRTPAAPSLNGRLVYHSMDDSQFVLLDMKTGTSRKLGILGQSPALSPGGGQLAFLGNDGRIRLRRLADGQERTIGGGDETHSSPEFITDRQIGYLRFDDEGASIRLLALDSGKERVYEAELPPSVSADSEAAPVIGHGGQLRGFVLCDRQELYLIKEKESPKPFGISAGQDSGCAKPSVSPDGKTAVFVSAAGNIVSVQTNGTNLRRLGGNKDSNSVAWSPDGKYLAFVSAFPLKTDYTIETRLNRYMKMQGGSFSDAIGVMKPDGSDFRPLPGAGGKYFYAAREKISWK